MTKKQKLELVWPGKDERPKLEPRILIEDPQKSYHSKARHSEDDQFENMLIKGDNLLALKALEQDYAGKVKCVFIDPPYNTGSAFEHYDDGIEHSLWLSLMRDRLELIHKLLSDDGSLWVTLDDNEAHYFKVMCDEIFGRKNFIANIVWQKAFAKKNKAQISVSHDHIFLYSRDKSLWQRNKLPREANQLSAYKNVDNDYRGLWQSISFSVSSEDGERRAAYRYEITLPSGRKVSPPKGSHWKRSPENFKKLLDDNKIWFGRNGDSPPRIKLFLSEVDDGIVPDTWWKHEEAGNNQEAKKQALANAISEEPFGTPKPEKLLNRILQIATNTGDLVLDSFAGSGTTGAVAQKMSRKWIMVELGDHADTHILPRLQKVIDGEDQGGISKAVDWKGGGGFRYYNLAPSLLKEDKYGRWIISDEYNPEMLAEALCKHMGFAYAPSDQADEYWNHGHSTETDFIYVTTQTLTHDACKKIAEDVGEHRTLLICCKAFNADVEHFENLTLVKIPTAILSKCEWRRDDYSLEVSNLPQAQEPDEDTVEQKPADDLPLFGGEGDKA